MSSAEEFMESENNLVFWEREFRVASGLLAASMAFGSDADRGKAHNLFNQAAGEYTKALRAHAEILEAITRATPGLKAHTVFKGHLGYEGPKGSSDPGGN